eukprot:172887-Rhodomonas_salina.1
MPGTELAYGAKLSSYARAMRCPVPSESMLLLYLPKRVLCGARYILRVCCAMPGTDSAYAGTRHGQKHRAQRCSRPVASPLSAYAPPTRCPVLTSRIGLRSGPPLVLTPGCYAMSGTDVGSAGTRRSIEAGKALVKPGTTVGYL